MARASQSCKLQNMQKCDEFTRYSDQIEKEQRSWVTLAEKMTSEFETLKAENKELYKQARQMGLISASGKT